jgi:cytochrome c
MTVVATVAEGQPSGEIELRIDTPEGKLIGKTYPGKPVKITETTGIYSLYLIFRNDKAGDQDLFEFVALHVSLH